jgi:hypothetical protein
MDVMQQRLNQRVLIYNLQERLDEAEWRYQAAKKKFLNAQRKQERCAH